MPRPLRPECALILDGWHDEQIRRADAWMAENLPYPKRDPGPIAIPPKKTPAEWPDEDPEPIITNRDPRPEGVSEPRAVLDIIQRAQGWGWDRVLAAYSLGYRREVKVGSYRKCEAWGVYSAPHPETGHRFIAIYDRNPEAKTWSWSSILAAGHPVTTVTLLKEWLAVQGQVPDTWYQREKKKITAKKTTKVREHGG